MGDHGEKSISIITMNTRYLYTVWFKDLNVTEHDPDFEWPACFLIESKSVITAKQWGDYLAKCYASSSKQEFNFSEIEVLTNETILNIETLPLIQDSEDVNDQFIGW